MSKHDGLNPFQFRDRVIRLVLHILGPKFESEAAVNLLVGTAIQETNLDHLVQVSGPALGFYQIEPKTYDDLMLNYFFRGMPWEILSQQNAERRMRREMYLNLVTGFESSFPPKIKQLEGDMYYQTAVARFIYWRIPHSLPAANDLPGLAAYWKQYWNTPMGAGTEQQFIDNWNRAMT